MKYTIYKHTIADTDKSYIGFTVLTMEKRLQKHFTNAECGIKTKFYNAIIKYGRESIISEILDYAESQKEAYEKEAFYIEKEDTYKNGYNSTKKGGGGWIIGQLSLEKQKLYFEKRSDVTKGNRNPNHSGYSDDDIIKFAAEVFKQNDYVFNIKIWYEHAKKNGYPMTFSKCRFDGYGMMGFKRLICEYLQIDELKKYKPSDEHRKKLSENQKEMCWITNGNETLRIYKKDKFKYEGWEIGRHKLKNKNNKYD
jgi:hypothetical protein